MPQPTSPEPVNVSSLHALVLDEHVADLAGGAGDDVDPARRQACLLLELGEEERGERRRRRRLQHDGAACGERGRDLVRDEVEREVERRDRADDPDRQAAASTRAFPRPQRTRPSAPSRPRACAPRRPRTCRSRPRAAPRPALPSAACPASAADDLGRFLLPLVEQPRGQIEDPRALVRRQRIAHRALGGIERPARLRGASLRDATDDFARERGADVGPVARLDALAVRSGA